MSKRNGVAVTSDFDGTLVPIAEPVMVAVDTRAVHHSGRPELEAMREKYVSRFHGGGLSPADERKWFTRTLDIYVERGLYMHDVREALRDIKAKPGVHGCLRHLHELGVPIAIVSFSVKQFVEEVLRHNHLLQYVDRVYATELIVDEESGRVTGYRPETIVLPSLKGRWSRQFADEMKVPHAKLLGVGDTRGDRFIGSRKDRRLGLAKDDHDAEILRQYMGTVLVDGKTFHGASDWLMERIERPR